MNALLQIVIPAFVAFFCTSWIYPIVLRVAKTKNIVDNPDARKLQRRPVPILGGLTVVFGVLSGLMAFNLLGNTFEMFPVFSSIIIILVIGLIDDMISLSPKVRFVVEILLVLYMIGATGCQLNNFDGLWGLSVISNYVSIPLTVVACVGIINAINLIDGVDGYSSGYSIVCCTLFGAMFYALGEVCMASLAAVVAASLLPFFIHNVFGKYSKMFIGDAGTLSLGIVFSAFVTTMLSADYSAVERLSNMSLIPFALAVLSVPVFDTLRVMSARMWRGRSPFSPDKTHLHHLFIELGFSHIGTASSIIGMNMLVVASWYVACRCGLSVEEQLYIVLVLGFLVTFVFYPFVKSHLRRQTGLYRALNAVAKQTHIERRGFWLKMQRLADFAGRKKSGE